MADEDTNESADPVDPIETSLVNDLISSGGSPGPSAEAPVPTAETPALPHGTAQLTGPAFAPGTSKEMAQAIVSKTRDPMTLDLEPRSKKPILFANVFGEATPTEELDQHKYGKKLIGLMQYERQGHGWTSELGDELSKGWREDVPYVGGAYNNLQMDMEDYSRVPDVLARIRADDPNVPQDDKLMARFYLAEQERRAMGGLGRSVGGMIHSAAGFGSQFWLDSKLGSGAAKTFGYAVSRNLAADAGAIAAEELAGPETAGAGTVAGVGTALYDVFKAARAVGATMRDKELAQEAAKQFFAKESLVKEVARKAFPEFHRAGVRTAQEVVGLEAMESADLSRAATGAWGYTREGGVRAASGLARGVLLHSATTIAGNRIGNQIAGNPDIGIAPGGATIEKQAEGAWSGNERLSRYAQALALGEQVAMNIAVSSGEALHFGINANLGKAIRAAAGSVAPETSAGVKGIAEMLGREYRTTEEMATQLKDKERMKAVGAIGTRVLDLMVNKGWNPKAQAQMLKDAGMTGWLSGLESMRYASFLNGLYGSEGEDDPGIKNALKRMVPEKQELISEAIGFALPIAVMAGTAKLGMSKFVGAQGETRMREHMNAIKHYVSSDEGVVVIRPDGTTGPLKEGEESLATPGVASAMKGEDAMEGMRPIFEPVRGPKKFAQRAAQIALRAARVLVTGNPDHLMWDTTESMMAGNDLDAHPVRTYSELREKIVDEHLDKARKAMSGADEVSADDVKNLTRENIARRPEVVKEIREAARRTLDEYAASVKNVYSTTESVVKEYAEAHGDDPVKLARSMENAVKDGAFAMVISNGHKYYIPLIDGKHPGHTANERARMNLLQDRMYTRDRAFVLGDEGTVRAAMDLEGYGSVLINPDAPAAEQVKGLLAARGIHNPTDEHVRGLTDMVSRFIDAVNEHGTTRVQSGPHTFDAVRDEAGNYRLRGLTDAASDFLQNKGRVGDRVLADLAKPDKASLLAELKSIGGDQVTLHKTGIRLSPVTLFAHEDPVKMATEFSDRTGIKAGSDEYAAYQQHLNEGKKPSDHPLYKKSLEALRKMEGYSHVKINGKEYHQVNVAGSNYRGDIIAPLPRYQEMKNPPISAGIHELIEAWRKQHSDSYHPSERDFYPKMGNIIRKLAVEELDKNPEKAAKWAAVAKWFDDMDGKLNPEAFTAAFMTMTGWPEYTSGGQKRRDYEHAELFSKVRQAVTKDPEAMDAAAKFMRFAAGIVGHNGGLEALGDHYLPPNAGVRNKDIYSDNTHPREWLKTMDDLNTKRNAEKEARKTQDEAKKRAEAEAKAQAKTAEAAEETKKASTPKPEEPEAATKEVGGKVLTAEELKAKLEELGAKVTDAEINRLLTCSNRRVQKATPAKSSTNTQKPAQEPAQKPAGLRSREGRNA